MKNDRHTTGRREFLKGVAVAGGAATVAAAGAAALTTADPEAPAVPERPGAGDGGYRVTPHIERYYRLARF